MEKNTRCARRRRRGLAVLEFALVTPLFLLIAMAAIDFGRVFRITMLINGANHDGLLFACQSAANAGNSAGIATAAKTAGGNVTGLNVTSSTFCTCSLGGAQVACTNSCSGKISYVQVNTTLSFSTLAAWPWVPNTLTADSTGVMRVQ